jgi:ubiquinol-cytochrome c reductase cytochrome c subunit
MLLAAAAAGAMLYTQFCSSCHGTDLRGGANAPSIRDVGAASVDFWVGTGRMPAAVPWIEEGHRNTQFTQEQINALTAYVTSVAPGGQPIPVVDATGNAKNGRKLYEQNCEHCHGVYGEGASIGANELAPGLHEASIVQVAEAIRIGPGQMPVFGEKQLDERALKDVVAYVWSLDSETAQQAVPLRSSGPVPEGLFGWLAVALLSVFAFAYSRGAGKT